MANTKKEHSLGKIVKGECMYSNNNGWIIMSSSFVGLYNGEISKVLHSGDLIETLVIGYDEDNMMLILADL